jgi:hypothetical protein
MWALEYDPNLFWMYEEAEDISPEEAKARLKSIRHYGKYERENMRNGAKNTEEPPLPISIFLVASVLKEKSATLLQQARGLDDVVKVCYTELEETIVLIKRMGKNRNKKLCLCF